MEIRDKKLNFIDSIISKPSQITYVARTDSGRDIAVIQGNSGILYPFYCSTGLQSGQKGTWFPWMGYFESHPKQANQLYMVKPKIGKDSLLPEEIVKLFSTHVDKEVQDVITRIGNVETLMISCSIGGGIWDKYPDLRQMLLESDYNRYIINITFIPTDEIKSSSASTKIVEFQGIAYRGKESVHAYKSHVAMAAGMESFIEKQSSLHHPYSGFVQTMPLFPSHKMLETCRLEQTSLKRQLQELAVDLLEKCSEKSIKIELITRLSALLSKAESFNEIENFFKLLTKISLQRTGNKYSLFSSSTVGSELEKTINLESYQKLKIVFFNKQKVDYSDLRKFVIFPDDKTHFNVSNSKTNFDAIEKEISELEQRAQPKLSIKLSL